MATAEAATPTTEYRKTTDKNVFLSPLDLYKRKYCKFCESKDFCNASFNRRLLCILAALHDTTQRNNQLNQQRGAHR